MVDILLFAMVIASAVSLVVVSPRQAKQETLRALRDYNEMLSLHACGGTRTQRKRTSRQNEHRGFVHEVLDQPHWSLFIGGRMSDAKTMKVSTLQAPSTTLNLFSSSWSDG